MLPAISPAVISHLAMPNSGVHRYAAALQSLVSAGARDRLARAEEPVVRRLCAGASRIRTPGPGRRRREVSAGEACLPITSEVDAQSQFTSNLSYLTINSLMKLTVQV